MKVGINNNLFEKIIFFSFFYFLLIIGFIFNENSTGGAIVDYFNQKTIVQAFVNNFEESFFSYDKFSTRHSPTLIIFLSFFEKLNINDYIIRLIHLHFCLLLPIFFYLSLKLKFNFTNQNNLYLLVGIIFLSPTFRSLSIWPDSRMLGMTVFCLSIYYYLKFEENKKFKNCVLNIITCALASYLSPNFSVFALFYFYKFIIAYNKEFIKIIYIIILNLILAFPAIYYVFILDIIFFNKPAAISIDLISNEKNIFFKNIFNQILLVSSIIFFYCIPFIFTKIISLNKILNPYKLILSLFVLIISIYFFDYKYEYTGGGILYKFSYFIFNNNYLFYFICFFSILIVIDLTSTKIENLFILLLIFVSNPQISVYHKYFDPMLIIFLFILFDFKINKEKININYNKYLLYLFFGSFLIVSNLKYLWNT